MTVKLFVNWEDEEILTEQELDEMIAEVIEEHCEDEELFELDMADYIDDHYNTWELFQVIRGDSAMIVQTIDEIHSGTRDKIAFWCDKNIRLNYQEIDIEV